MYILKAKEKAKARSLIRKASPSVEKLRILIRDTPIIRMYFETMLTQVLAIMT